MNKLLNIRKRIQDFYSKNDGYLGPILKAVCMLVILLVINTKIGYSSILCSWNIVLIATLAAALLPWNAMTFIAAIYSVIHLFSLSWEIAAVAILIYIIAAALQYVFLPGFGIAVVLIPVFYYLHIPYLIPIVLGLVGGSTTFIPACTGTLVYFFINGASSNAEYYLRGASSTSATMEAFPQILSIFKDNNLMLISIITFGVITLATYFIRRRPIDFAAYIAAGAGGIIGILLFVIGGLAGNIAVPYVEMLIGSVISIALAMLIEFWLVATDYDHTEFLQYEDDDYVYYVKAVPKIKITTKQVEIKEITKMDSDSDIEDEERRDDNA